MVPTEPGRGPAGLPGPDITLPPLSGGVDCNRAHRGSPPGEPPGACPAKTTRCRPPRPPGARKPPTTSPLRLQGPRAGAPPPWTRGSPLSSPLPKREARAEVGLHRPGHREPRPRGTPPPLAPPPGAPPGAFPSAHHPLAAPSGGTHWTATLPTGWQLAIAWGQFTAGVAILAGFRCRIAHRSGEESPGRGHR